MKDPHCVITYFSRYISHAVKVLENKMPARNYEGAIETLNQVQTNAQYIKSIANKQRESNIHEVTKFLNRTGLELSDLDKLSVVHVTGTNGKGTTCAYTEQILRNHGYTTGFFSSPHLLDVRERIRLNGKPISKDEFSNYFWKIYDLLNNQKEHATDLPLYFRFLTIIAFHIFLDKKVDVAILEVGIGGEYDCTNIVRKTAVVGITPLDMDHTTLLGNSLECIAWNKSGIMKEGCAAFTTSQPSNALKIFQERSVEKKCTLTVVDSNFCEEYISNIPLHIRKTNASLALALTEAYMKKDTNNNLKKFDLAIAKRSIQETHWPGRYEIKQYNDLVFYLDGAHTIESSCVCRDWYLSHIHNDNKKRCLVFNLTGERDPDKFFKELKKCNFHVVIFIPNVGGANDKPDTADFKFPEDQQLQKCQDYKIKWLEMEENSNSLEIVKVLPSFSSAVDFLEKSGKYNTLVTGSILLIGAALSVLDPTLSGALED